MAEWIKAHGQDNDIVISSRIRLARNISNKLMPTKLNKEQAQEIIDLVYDSLKNSNASISHEFELIQMDQTSPLEKQVLVEKHLISPDLSKGTMGAVLIQKGEQVSIMINEEDHLRIQCIMPGFQLNKVWNMANKMDDLLEEIIPFSFHEKWGYLTACPTNIGTGMRASVMVHLPCLVLTGQINSLMQTIAKFGLTIRGIYGEGTEFLGDLFQISNQVTLGSTEEDIINNIHSVAKEIIKRERQIRANMKEYNPLNLQDKIYRAYGILKNARILSSEESMKLLSYVRLGIDLEYIEDISIDVVNHLMINTQAGMLQKKFNKSMDEKERDFIRTEYIREKINN
jgi:protein arginine kinase